MSTTYTQTTAPTIQPQQDTFREERDALLPRNGYVIITAEDGEGQEYLKIPRLNMRRTLRLSQWLDAVGGRDDVQKTLSDLMSVMDSGVEDVDGASGLGYMLTINKFIATLELQEALELFSIITNQSHEWLDERWELGWGIQAVRVAFQQQGFSNLFANAANQDGGETATGKTTPEEVSVPQSISSSQHMGGQTIASLNSHPNE